MKTEEIRKKEFLALQRAHEEEMKFKAQEADSDNKINKLIQASHMLISLSMNFFSEAEDLLQERGVVLEGSISKSHFYYTKAANNYCREFSTMIKTEDEKAHYWQNLQEIETKMRIWAGLDKGGSWIKVKDGLPEPGKKVVVVTKNGNYGLNSTTEFSSGIEWKGTRKFTDSIVAWMPISNYETEEKK